MEELCARIEEVDGIVTPCAPSTRRALAQARERDAETAAAARGPLHGGRCWSRTTSTPPAWPPRPGRWRWPTPPPPSRDAPLVRAAPRRPGMVVLGKTNLSEWANIRDEASTSGWSAYGGLTRNPYALNRTAGGSSSGAARRSPPGSRRSPSAPRPTARSPARPRSTAASGIKPTVGLVPTEGVVPDLASQDVTRADGLDGRRGRRAARGAGGRRDRLRRARRRGPARGQADRRARETFWGYSRHADDARRARGGAAGGRRAPRSSTTSTCRSPRPTAATSCW